MNKDWISDLKEGDAAIIAVRMGSPYVSKVEKVTKLHVIFPHNRKFNKVGYEVGAGQTGAKIEEPTPERLAAIKHRRLTQTVAQLASVENLGNLSIEELNQIGRIIIDARDKNKVAT